MTVLPFKNKSNILILKLILVLLTYGYISYKIYYSREIPRLIQEGIAFDRTKTGFVFVIILMIINWLMEAIKWRILVSRIKK